MAMNIHKVNLLDLLALRDWRQFGSLTFDFDEVLAYELQALGGLGSVWQ